MMLRAARSAIVPCRQLSSVLFISDGCTTERPVLNPTPDLAVKFKDIEKLKQNLKVRSIDTDADGLKELFEFFCSLDEMRKILEKRKIEIASQVKDLVKIGDEKAEKDKKRLVLEGRIVKTDLKNLMPGYWEVEERLMLNCLALPNDIHPRTPLDTCQVMLPPKSTKPPLLDHLIVAKDLIDFRSPHWYYLKKSAAIFDLALMHYFLEGMKSADFKTMVLPDFAHSAVVEACGTEPTNSIGIEPMKERFNLVGGASIFPFCVYYARLATNYRNLPGRHTTGGRRYTINEGDGLFGAWQRTCVDFFSFSHSEDVEPTFDKSVDTIRALYDALGWDYQIKLVSATLLKPWESSRVSFQMLARHGWVEIGHVSTSGTFLTERLSMKIECKNGSKEFGHVVSGSSVDVTLVLACLLEQNADLFPDCLKPHAFGLY